MADEKKAGALSSAPKRKAADGPGNDREIAEATGVSSLGEKVREIQGDKNVKRFRNVATGEITIEGETPEQLRARVKEEREEAEPSEFQRSVLGGPGPVERVPVKASEL